MNKSNNSKTLDLREQLGYKVLKYSRFFDGSSILALFSEKELSDVKGSSKIVEILGKKGTKLIEIAKTLQDLADNYFKQMKKLEEFKEIAQYQIEKLEIALEGSENKLEHTGKTIEDLNAYIEDVEKHLLEVSAQRDEYKKELQTTKKATKILEVELQSFLQQEKVKTQKKTEEDLKKTESYKSELANKEKTIEKLEEKLRFLQKLLEKEKSFCTKTFENSERLKSDIFELKNKLSEEKLKKTNYKDLYKDLIQSRAVKVRNYSVQTNSDFDLDSISHPDSIQSEEENDLYSLEEEQSRAHSVTCSLELKESYNNLKSQFFLLSQPSSRLTLEKTCSFEINPNKKLKSLQTHSLGGFTLLPRKEQQANLYTISARQVKEKVSNGKVRIKKKFLECGAEMIQVKHSAHIYSAPSSPTTQVVQLKQWDETFLNQRLQAPVVEVSQVEPEEEEEKSVNKRKGYFASFCQGVRVTCEYGSKIRPRELFSSIGRLKQPITALPGTIQGLVSGGYNKT
jgi:hypothetical protein